jgi:hypothetical protein
MVDQEYIKVLLDKSLSVNFALSTRDMQSRILDHRDSRTQKHERIGSATTLK